MPNATKPRTAAPPRPTQNEQRAHEPQLVHVIVRRTFGRRGDLESLAPPAGSHSEETPTALPGSRQAQVLCVIPRARSQANVGRHGERLARGHNPVSLGRTGQVPAGRKRNDGPVCRVRMLSPESVEGLIEEEEMTICQVGVQQPYAPAADSSPLQAFVSALRDVPGARVALLERPYGSVEVHVYVPDLWADEADQVYALEAAMIRQFPEGTPSVYVHGMREDGVTPDTLPSSLPHGALLI